MEEIIDLIHPEIPCIKYESHKEINKLTESEYRYRTCIKCQPTQFLDDELV